jgi:hypothetical protein
MEVSMTTNDRPRSMTEDVSKLLFNQVEALFGKWQRRGYCPCCVARTLLLHAGERAVLELVNEDLHQVLDHLAEASEQHGPPPSGDTIRH